MGHPRDIAKLASKRYTPTRLTAPLLPPTRDRSGARDDDDDDDKGHECSGPDHALDQG